LQSASNTLAPNFPSEIITHVLRMTKTRKSTPKTRSSTKGKSPSPKTLTSSPPLKKSTVYADFAIYRGEHAPKWHPIRKMRYVFFRMINGRTVTDAIDEIHWNASEFWHLVDLKRHGPFREEYKRAKLLQGRSFADSVVTIAEGRDETTRQQRKRLARLLQKTIKRVARTKNAFKAKMLMQQLISDLHESEKDVMTRNKMQIDASKWMAKTTNPNEFGDKATMALGSPDESGKQRPVTIQFVGPDGKAVPL
jgi:5-carboxymethyl-2-hydroxymuconate isomerase